MSSYFIPGEEDQDRRFEVERLEDGAFRVTDPDGQVLTLDAYEPAPGRLNYIVRETGLAIDAGVRPDGAAAMIVEVGDERHHVEVINDRQRRMQAAGLGPRKGGGPELTSPMAGKVVAINSAVGDAVEEGECVLIVEAMKMENDLKAHISGTIAEIPVEVGQAVEIGDVLAVIAAE